jgi:hypothetical protein
VWSKRRRRSNFGTLYIYNRRSIFVKVHAFVAMPVLRRKLRQHFVIKRGRQVPTSRQRLRDRFM